MMNEFAPKGPSKQAEMQLSQRDIKLCPFRVFTTEAQNHQSARIWNQFFFNKLTPTTLLLCVFTVK